MNKGLIKALVIIGSLLLVFSFLILPCISASNKEVKLRNQFNQKKDERTSFHDKMRKILKGKAEVAVRNDSSFRKNIEVIMNNRKDGEQILMKWITESNPNANFSEVSVIYQDVSRAIEAERNGFFVQEKMIQDIKLQHDNLLDEFPGFILFAILGREHLDYTPIASDYTNEVMKTGRDNETSVF